MKTKTLITIGLFCSLLILGANIKINVFIVPITLQTLFVFLTGLMLEKKAALYTILLYVFMGLSGLPVFAGGGGIAYVLKPSIVLKCTP